MMINKKWLFILFAYILLPLRAFALEVVSVSAEADQYAVAGKPIEVSVMVTHRSSSKVGSNSFKIGDSPLKVDFFKDVSMSENSDLVISIYQFTMDPKKKGLYTLPPVTVNVGGKEYVSFESSYSVR